MKMAERDKSKKKNKDVFYQVDSASQTEYFSVRCLTK